jgi:hypothetical protein
MEKEKKNDVTVCMEEKRVNVYTIFLSRKNFSLRPKLLNLE